MQVSTSTIVMLLSVCTLCLLEFSTPTNAAPQRQKRSASLDPDLAVAVLEQLIEEMRDDSTVLHKRRVDAGYGSRYGVASSVGSKLMALKQAADWNGPGRKRRDAADVAAQTEDEQ